MLKISKLTSLIQIRNYRFNRHKLKETSLKTCILHLHVCSPPTTISSIRVGSLPDSKHVKQYKHWTSFTKSTDASLLFSTVAAPLTSGRRAARIAYLYTSAGINPCSSQTRYVNDNPVRTHSVCLVILLYNREIIQALLFWRIMVPEINIKY